MCCAVVRCGALACDVVSCAVMLFIALSCNAMPFSGERTMTKEKKPKRSRVKRKLQLKRVRVTVEGVTPLIFGGPIKHEVKRCGSCGQEIDNGHPDYGP